jgi:intermediate peptidase
MRGVDSILSRLLGLSFVAEDPEEGELWHPAVQKYTINDGAAGRVLGVLYLDPFARQGKVVQSAQFTLQGSKILDNGPAQIPVAALVFSLPSTGSGLPVHHAVTFMHEMGHALHSLLSETTLQHLSGTRGTVDFVEFPSHLFEHFVLDADCLSTYARHAQTGAHLPASLREAHRESRDFAHFEALQQLMYAALDQSFYSCPASMATRVQEHLSSSLAPYDEDLAGPFQGSLTSLLGLSQPSKFDHLVHYGGSYYCYLFNRALSAHVWKHGFHGDPFHADAGSRLRQFFRGGSVVQDLDAIQALCPATSSFKAEDVPLEAFVEQLGSTH